MRVWFGYSVNRSAMRVVLQRHRVEHVSMGSGPRLTYQEGEQAQRELYSTSPSLLQSISPNFGCPRGICQGLTGNLPLLMFQRFPHGLYDFVILRHTHHFDERVAFGKVEIRSRPKTRVGVVSARQFSNPLM